MPALLALHHGVGANDSVIFHAGAVLCGPQLYRSDLQHELVGAHNALFWRAPFYACMMRPLLLFNFPIAFLLVNLMAVAGLILALPSAIGKYPYYLSPLIVVFAPFAYNFSIEQDGAIVLLILSLTLAAEAAEFPFLAGAILALTLEKPSLFLLLPVMIAAQKKYRMLYGYLAGASVLILLSVWIVGGAAVGDYVNIVSQYKQTPEKMPTARGIAAAMSAFPLWPALSLIAVVATVWRTRRGNFRAAFCTAIVGSLFVSPESYAHDLSVLLLPVLYFLFNGSTLQRVVSGLWFVPLIPYVYIHYSAWSVCVALLLALFLLSLVLDRNTMPGPNAAGSEGPAELTPEAAHAS